MKTLFSIIIAFIFINANIFAQFKASEGLSAAETKVESSGLSSPELVMIATLNGEIKISGITVKLNFSLENGSNMGWVYIFKSQTGEDKKNYFVYDMFGTMYPYEINDDLLSGLKVTPGPTLDGTTWKDSDEMAGILTNFQAYNDFMTANPSASVHYISLSVADDRNDIPDGTPFWWVEMYSNSSAKDLFIAINAVSGEAYVSTMEEQDALKVTPEAIALNVNGQILKDDSVSVFIKNVSEENVMIKSCSFEPPVSELQFINPLDLIDKLLEPGDSLEVKIRFTPVSEGITQSSLLIEYEYKSETLEKSILTFAQALLSKSPHAEPNVMELDFGEIATGTTGNRYITICNTGDTVLLINDYYLSGKDKEEFLIYNLNFQSKNSLQ